MSASGRQHAARRQPIGAAHDQVPVASPANENAQRQVEWLANTLVDMLGVEECNRLLEELGL